MVIRATHHAQEWAIAAQPEKQTHTEATIPEEYKRHAVVFSEEAAKRIPPRRPKDHEIKLKEGAPEFISC